jgi:membrane-bound metal-dependent hydrolase YbcI (DUF457 family)
MIALLVIFQAVTKSLGQFVTGSGVNLFWPWPPSRASACGVIVALVSPFFRLSAGYRHAHHQLMPA